MNITKYSGCRINWDLCGDGRFSTYKAFDKQWKRYWRKQMLKKIYGLRCKVEIEK